MKSNLKMRATLGMLAGLLLTLTACDPFGVRANGDLETETRQVSDFHALEIDVCGKVEMHTDTTFRVEVTCEESVIAYLETVEDNGVLKILFDRNVYDVDDLKIRVWAPSWDGIEINGSADVDLPDAIQGNQLNLTIGGSGNIKVFDADFANTKAVISGSGDITLIGKTDNLHLVISGSGDVDAVDYPAKTATVHISGSGDARVDVSETLEATISGSGSVRYEGNPQVDATVTGSGTVKKI